MAKKSSKRPKQMAFHVDNDPSTGQRLYGRVTMEAGGLCIYVKGYGNSEGAPSPIAALVLQDGKLRLLGFTDYNAADPVTIDLEGAREP